MGAGLRAFTPYSRSCTGCTEWVAVVRWLGHIDSPTFERIVLTWPPTKISPMIATIEDSLRIADDGKAKRTEAEQSLLRMEQELKQTLAAAKARATGTGESVGRSA